MKNNRSTLTEHLLELRNRLLIIIATIAMARSFNLNVIAEGVETEEQRQFLIEHDCDEVQGFLFCKPVSAEAIEQLFSSENRRVS